MSNAKVEYIRNITNAITNGTLDLEALKRLSDEEVVAILTKIRGIGNWTAKMYLIFVLDRQDVLPIEDGAFLQVFRWMYKTQNCNERIVTAKCKKWKPFFFCRITILLQSVGCGNDKRRVPSVQMKGAR